MHDTPTPGLTMRPGTADDAAALAALDAELFGGDSWSVELLADSLAQPHNQVLVAIDGDEECGRVIGYAITALGGEIVDLLRIGVHADHQRRGIARQLLDQVVRDGRMNGADRMLLEVSSANTGALDFYARAGFTQIDRRPRYYADGSDALVLRVAVLSGCSWNG